MSATERDLSHLIAAIPGDLPAGPDPRTDDTARSELASLKDDAKEARRTERDAVNDGRDPVDALPLWRSVAERAQSILTERAKHLEAGCCLLEAWVRLEGFSGLRNGLTVLRELMQQYGETLYPAPEDGESASARVDCIDKMSGRLPEAISWVPITTECAVGPFATWQYQQAAQLAGYSDKDREERIRRGAITMEQVDQAVRETPTSMYQSWLADLDASLKELQALDNAIMEHCPASEAPSTSPVAEKIEQIEGVIRTLAGERLAAAEDASEQSASGAAGGGIEVMTALGPLRTREDAFRALSQVADFFQRMDPQSLLAAHIRRILRLGKMSTVEYFTEMVEDEAARTQLFKLLGLTPQQPPPE